MQPQNLTGHYLCIIETNYAFNNMELQRCLGSTAMDICLHCFGVTKYLSQL
jgi:hypothetical protein